MLIARWVQNALGLQARPGVRRRVNEREDGAHFLQDEPSPSVLETSPPRLGAAPSTPEFMWSINTIHMIHQY